MATISAAPTSAVGPAAAVSSKPFTASPDPIHGFSEQQTSHEDGIPEHARKRISELESQVRILAGRATDAVYKLADYEQKFRQIRAGTVPEVPKAKDSESLPTTPGSADDTSLQKQVSAPGRFGSFLSRKNTVGHAPSRAQASNAAAIAAAREQDLNKALDEERELRQQAETKVSQMSAEVEELSSTLFQQANEMVATEREARVKLEQRAQRFEERCGVLEERVRVLEKRDADKRRRLDRLEDAVKRCERVRALLHAGVR